MSTEQAEAPSAAPPPGHRTILGHPRGLVPLFGIETWERFSFYGLQLILAYYLYYQVSDGGLGMSQGVALGITGSYGALVYFSQMLGAWLADRVLAPKRLVFCSALLIALGHVALALIAAVPGPVIGLLLIVLGTGGLKVNVTSMVGALYRGDSVRRDAGFAIYYMGITFGGFLGPLVTGPLQTGIGFHAAFTAAAVGIVIGLVIYVVGGKSLPQESSTVANPLSPRARVRAAIVAAAVVAVVVAVVATGLVGFGNVSAVVAGVVVVASIAYFVVLLTAADTTKSERHNVRAYLPIFFATVVFWTLLFQLFTTFAVYSDTRVDLTVGSLTLPAAYIVTGEAVFATIAAPFLAALWTKLGTRQPATPTKMGLGLLVMSVAYLIFAVLSGTSGAVNNLWVVMVGMVVFAIAEVTVAPAAMSIATKLAPRQFPSQMMSLYFLTMAGGSTLSGLISQLYRPTNEGAFFSVIAGTTVAFVLVFLAIVRKLRPIM